MDLKKILLAAVIGFLSFAVMFALSWFTGGDGQQAVAQSTGPQSQPGQQENSVQEIAIAGFANQTEEKDSLSEMKLKGLIYDVRTKKAEYENKISMLKEEEERLKITRDVLADDIKQLENLVTELTAKVTQLKDAEAKLEQSRIKIEKNERENLTAVAAAYDKMDPVQAGKILVNMTKLKNTGPEGNTGVEDAIKILYFMGERPKADLLAELVNTEPSLAAFFSNKLKIISEK